MRRINITNLQEDMILAKPVYTERGVILLKEGTVITEAFIQKIKGVDVDYVYIDDALSKGIELQNIITEEVRAETQVSLKQTMDKMHQGYFVATEEVMVKVEKIVNDVLANPHVLVSIHEIRSRDDYAIQHAINVCVVSLLIGKKMGYNDGQLRHLALGSLLHDVGKTKIEMDLNKYRDRYIDADWQTYRTHVKEGYEMVKNMPDSSLLAANIALSHHEHYDGTGFPLGKKNTSIHEFARIVAVANEYDNLLFNRPTDNRLHHYEIIEMMVSRAYTWFDPEIIKVFGRSISPYPVATGVVLSDGSVGIVKALNDNFPTRPVIRVFDEETREVVKEVDLSKELNLMIVDEKEVE